MPSWIRSHFSNPNVIAAVAGIAGYLSWLIQDRLGLEPSTIAHDSPEAVLNVALAVGIYLTVANIDLTVLRKIRAQVFVAVTVGVVVKVIIASTIVRASGVDIRTAFLAAIAVAQIDPVSTSAQLRRSRVSGTHRAVTTLVAAWASFDDPMTLILGLIALESTGGNQATVASLVPLLGIAVSLALLISLRRISAVQRSENLQLMVVCVALLTAGIADQLAVAAVVGLWFRPAKSLRHSHMVLLLIVALAAFTLGEFSSQGLWFVRGVLLGCCVVLAHTVVAAALTAKQERYDRVVVAIAQQSGITAIVLASAFQADAPAVVGLVLPAIVTINVIHGLLTRFLLPRVVSR